MLEPDETFSLQQQQQQPLIVVLVDAHRTLGRPLCTDKELGEAISEEVSREAFASTVYAPWRLLSGSSEQQRKDLRSRAAAITAAVLSGSRKPPGGILRAVEVAADELAKSARGLQIRFQDIACVLLGDAEGPAEHLAQTYSPDQLLSEWDAAGSSAGSPSLEALCSSGAWLRGTSAVLVLTARRLPAGTLVELLLKTNPHQPSPALFWVDCAPNTPLPELQEVNDLCAKCSCGAGVTGSTEDNLRKAIQSALGSLRAVDERASAAEQAVCLPQACDGDAFEVVCTQPGPLGLDFAQASLQQGAWVVAASSQPSVQAGDVLLQVGDIPAHRPGSAAPAAVAAALREQRRPLALRFLRGGPQRPERSEEPGGAAGNEVMEAVLSSAAAADLESLAPEERRARIRELVAREVRRRQAPGEVAAEEAAKVVTADISGALDGTRPTEQRVLLEWLLSLCRTLAFCGDVLCLARACCASRLWKSALHPEGSELARRLWKWAVRFGSPLPDASRWAFWRWLLARHRRRRPPLASLGRAGYMAKVEHGRNDAAHAGARSVIAADLPRTFATDCGRACALLPASSGTDLEERRLAVERILLAVAAEQPSVGYCQGLDVVATFVLSVAEESIGSLEAAEAEAFAFLAAVLEFDDIRSWLEPPLAGLRTAVGALGIFLGQSCPSLASHLAAEGAGIELLTLSWLQTLFTGLAPLPRKMLCRTWECWLLDGSPKVFFRVALALFLKAESQLVGAPIERISEMLRSFPPPLDQHLEARILIPCAWATKVTRSRLRGALAEAAAELERAEQQSACPEAAVLEEAELEHAELVDVKPEALGLREPQIMSLE